MAGAGPARPIAAVWRILPPGRPNITGGSSSSPPAGWRAEFPKIIFHSGFKVTAFVEIAPAGLLQIGVSILHGKMQFLPEFGGVWMFTPLDWTHMGWLQTNDPILADMGVVVVHHLLLAVHHRDHSKPVPEPVGKQRFAIRNLGQKLSQLFGYQFNISQLFSCLKVFQQTLFNEKYFQFFCGKLTCLAKKKPRPFGITRL